MEGKTQRNILYKMKDMMASCNENEPFLEQMDSSHITPEKTICPSNTVRGYYLILMCLTSSPLVIPFIFEYFMWSACWGRGHYLKRIHNSTRFFLHVRYIHQVLPKINISSEHNLSSNYISHQNIIGKTNYSSSP